MSEAGIVVGRGDQVWVVEEIGRIGIVPWALASEEEIVREVLVSDCGHQTGIRPKIKQNACTGKTGSSSQPAQAQALAPPSPK